MKYPKLIEEIRDTLKFLLPKNKVSIVLRKGMNCVDVSVYSNQLNTWMPWKVGKGSKIAQQVRVPSWILEDEKYIRPCLKGLIQTDGCMYTDRGYAMVNFTSSGQDLADDVESMMIRLGFTPSHTIVPVRKYLPKHNVRIARDTKRFIETLSLYKA